MPENTLPSAIDPDAQVPLLDRLTDAARDLLGRVEHVAGVSLVMATGAAAAAAGELVDLGMVTRLAGAAYRLTRRGVAVSLYLQ